MNNVCFNVKADNIETLHAYKLYINTISRHIMCDRRVTNTYTHFKYESRLEKICRMPYAVGVSPDKHASSAQFGHELRYPL